jgi:GNAT superfamily N-acetyltransferase
MLRIVEEDRPGATDRELRERLIAFNEAHAGPHHHRHLVLSMRDENAALKAGLAAQMFWNTLYIDLLWVEEACRRRGYGASLLAAAERWAATRGCEVVYLSTFSFQAPAFYVRRGYAAFGELVDSPSGHRRIWMSKRLGPPEPTALRRGSTTLLPERAKAPFCRPWIAGTDGVVRNSPSAALFGLSGDESVRAGGARRRG